MNWWLFGVICAGLAAVWFTFEVNRATKDLGDDLADDAALDTIRSELEEQTAPSRPHIRSVS